MPNGKGLDKTRRHRLIRDAVSAGGVGSQEELRERLLQRGVEVTQATLSRDLREIGVVKGSAGYVLPGSEQTKSKRELQEDLDRAIETLMEAVEAAGHLVVLRTAPGHAGSLAVALDAAPPEGVVGTIAGDDTIFLAMRTTQRADELTRTFRNIAGLV